MPSAVALTVLLFCYGNNRIDQYISTVAQRRDHARALLQRAGSAGVFAALPPGATIAVDPTLPFANGAHRTAGDAAYAIYHYAGRRFHVVSERANAQDEWVLRTHEGAGVLVSLFHRANSRRQMVADKAIAYTVFPNIREALSGPLRGMRTQVRPTRDGDIITVERTCGPVSFDKMYETSRPTLIWRSGFYPSGPVGYTKAIPTPPLYGDAQPTYPEMFMGREAELDLMPSTCPYTTVNLRALAAAAVPSTITVVSPRHLDHILATPGGTPFFLIYDRANFSPGVPIRVKFITEAPESDIDRIDFHYKNDRPRHLRAAIIPLRVWGGLQ